MPNTDVTNVIPGQEFTYDSTGASSVIDNEMSYVRVYRSGFVTPGYGTFNRIKVRTVKTPDIQKAHPKPPKERIPLDGSMVLQGYQGRNWRPPPEKEFIVQEKKKPLPPRERLQIAATQLRPNLFTYNKREFKNQQGSFTKLFPNGAFITRSGTLSSVGGSFDGAQMNDWAPPPELRDAMRRQAILKIRGKLRDSKVNLPQVFAERVKTADLIASTATRLANSFLALKKGNLVRAAENLGIGIGKRKKIAFQQHYKVDTGNAVEKAWLELQYGWRPLLQDIHGAAEFLAQKQSHEVRNVVRSRQQLESHDDSQVFSAIDWTPLVNTVTFKERRYEISIVLWYSTPGGILATAKEAGFTNPAYLAWELLPFSFVVDWFLPVGKFLESLDATYGLSFEKGCITEFWDAKQKRIISANGRDLVTGMVYNWNGKSECREVFCVRTPLEDFPGIVLPQFKNPLSFEHAANAIALLTTVFSSKR